MLVDLTEFHLVLGDGDTSTVKDDKAGARGASVNGTNKPILQAVAMTVFIRLQERAIAVMCLVGVNVNIRLLLLLIDKRVEVGHIKRVPHCDRIFFFFLSW